MKVSLYSYGTRGDIQPFVALAHALREAGHEPLLVVPDSSASLAALYGLPCRPIFDGMKAVLDDPEVRAAMENNFQGVRGKLLAIRLVRQTTPLLRQVLDEMAAVPAGDADAVVHPINLPVQHLAERLGVPSVAVGLQPGWVPTSSFPSPSVPFRIPRVLNRASYRLSRLALMGLNRAAARWRTETLGLPRRPHQGDALQAPDGEPVTVLQAFSPRMLPGSANYPPTIHTTGSWFLPAADTWSPSPELSAFLEADDPMVSIGFGSMAGTDPVRVGRTVVEAVRLAGVRAVLISGWGGIDTGADHRVLAVDHVPHDWLFPRMSANVHHGGGGTSAAALASGRPQVVCPFIADQPFWGSQMYAAGVAPAPLPQRQLTATSLAAAIRQAVEDADLITSAAALGGEIRAENGVGKAVDMIEAATRRC